MKAYVRAKSKIINTFRSLDTSAALTALGFAAGTLDLILHAHSMGHPRYGLEFLTTLSLGAISGYKFAEKKLQELLGQANTINNSNEF